MHNLKKIMFSSSKNFPFLALFGGKSIVFRMGVANLFQVQCQHLAIKGLNTVRPPS